MPTTNTKDNFQIVNKRCRRRNRNIDKNVDGEQRINEKNNRFLYLALKSIQHGWKASYVWDLTTSNHSLLGERTSIESTNRNCHQIYSRLDRIKIEHSNLILYGGCRYRQQQQQIDFKDGDSRFFNCFCDEEYSSRISVLEFIIVAKNKEGVVGGLRTKEEENYNNYTFFGNIPQMIKNINSILVELDNLKPSVSEYNRFFDDGDDSENQNSSRLCENDSLVRVDGGSRFIDVSVTLTKPKIIQFERHEKWTGNETIQNQNELITKKQNKNKHEMNKEENVLFTNIAPSTSNSSSMLNRKYSLLHIRDYLRQNVNERCLTMKMIQFCQTPSVVSSSSSGNGFSHLNSFTNGNNDNSENQKLPEIDLCFLSGVLLGYPVIYCNETPEQGNCLSYQTLCHYSVWITSKTKPETFNNFQLYSFSIPFEFKHKFQHKVDNWFQCLKSKCPDDQFKLILSETLENHPLILT